MAALDLHYLMTFYGKAAAFEPERLLASVPRALEDRPVLTRPLINKAIAGNPGLLDGSDLDRAAEPVRAVAAALSLDELSKLWSVLFQVPYTCPSPTVAGRCSSRPRTAAARGSR